MRAVSPLLGGRASAILPGQAAAASGPWGKMGLKWLELLGNRAAQGFDSLFGLRLESRIHPVFNPTVLLNGRGLPGAGEPTR